MKGDRRRWPRISVRTRWCSTSSRGLPSDRGRAAVLEAPGELVVSDVEFADPGPGEVLVRLVASGLCHTDLGVIAGGIPFLTRDHRPRGRRHRRPCRRGRDRLRRRRQGAAELHLVRIVREACVTRRTRPTARPGCRGTSWGCSVRRALRLSRGTAPPSRATSSASRRSATTIADERSAVKVDPEADLTVLAPSGAGCSPVSDRCGTCSIPVRATSSRSSGPVRRPVGGHRCGAAESAPVDRDRSRR